MICPKYDVQKWGEACAVRGLGWALPDGQILSPPQATDVWDWNNLDYVHLEFIPIQGHLSDAWIVNYTCKCHLKCCNCYMKPKPSTSHFRYSDILVWRICLPVKLLKVHVIKGIELVIQKNHNCNAAESSLWVIYICTQSPTCTCTCTCQQHVNTASHVKDPSNEFESW